MGQFTLIAEKTKGSTKAYWEIRLYISGEEIQRTGININGTGSMS